MEDFFGSVVGGDDAAAKKPDAAPVLLAAQQLGIDAARLLMVGDSANDVDAARAAGSPVLAVPYGYTEGRPVQSFAADGIVDSLDDIPLWVRRA
jgi:phosphoglycolate phosphatase